MDDFGTQRDPEYDYPEPLPTDVYCCNCGGPTRVIRRDMGIGPYEYWGSKEVHHDYRHVTECCETVDWATSTMDLVEYWKESLHATQKRAYYWISKADRRDKFIRRLFKYMHKVRAKRQQKGQQMPRRAFERLRRPQRFA